MHLGLRDVGNGNPLLSSHLMGTSDYFCTLQFTLCVGAAFPVHPQVKVACW